MKPAPLMVEFSDGRQAMLPLTLIQRHLGMERLYLSSPGGCYGGWLAKTPLDERHAAEMRSLMTSELGSISWRLNPYDPSSAIVPDGAEADETHVLDLAGGFDAVFARWNAGQKWSLRKAKREGVTVRRARDLKDWRDHFELYLKTLRRWGSKALSVPYDWRQFELLHLRGEQEVRLWVAEHSGRTIASGVCLYTPRHVAYWHTAVDATTFRMQPVNLLVATMIEDACERKAAWFDFNPSAGLSGVTAFKESFGATRLSCPLLKLHSTRSAVLCRVWKTLSTVRRRVSKAASMLPTGNLAS
jgi:hypothetical protein